VRIDPLVEEDWQRFRSIRLRALADAPDAFARTLAEEVAFAEVVWRERLSNGSATFVAVEANADIGMVTGAGRRGRPGAAGLFGMWVAPGNRRNGVAQELVQAVVDWARANGLVEVALHVADQNRSAIRFYEKAGFVPTGDTSSLPAPREHLTEHERSLVIG
jgi:GNAT superfamily N-acetyltransferase